MELEIHVKNLSSMWSTRVHWTQVPWKNLNGTRVSKKKKKNSKSTFAITQCSKNRVLKQEHFFN